MSVKHVSCNCRLAAGPVSGRSAGGSIETLVSRATAISHLPSRIIVETERSVNVEKSLLKLALKLVCVKIEMMFRYNSDTQRGTQFGELMFSLSYLPTAERLTVVIVKARNLRFPQGRDSGDPFVKNKVLRKIFGAKRDEVTGEWRKLHNTELHVLYTSPDIIRTIKSRRLRWAGHVARMGESRNAYRVLVGRPEGKRPLRRPRRRWEDNIKMDLREVGYDGRDWINLVQDRDQWRTYVRAALNLRLRAHLARRRCGETRTPDASSGTERWGEKSYYDWVEVRKHRDVDFSRRFRKPREQGSSRASRRPGSTCENRNWEDLNLTCGGP
ncbi:hypothetical protein ANN_18590 [Periplaneta americana]|uniref:Uncharacterized protein n=1 Tax=Periplaneta americana TaxID=6978 RepID=A0ABQ8SQN3_PERAM|nr:hypothetical protein ANN_18590 [Periplaneta americana]